MKVEIVLGDELGGGTRKVRMAIVSKGKGKRGGALLGNGMSVSEFLVHRT